MKKNWQPIHTMPPLDAEERRVLLDAATEVPNTGRYNNFFEEGVYLCRQCGAPLYRSEDKFTCHCGWPAFENALPEAVERRQDADGRRTEIICANCGGHLGHVFEGERLTIRNVRHCVNSLSLFFIPTQRALFAGGCFWGMEDFFSRTPGVLLALSGYAGGNTKNPTYRDVCGGETGHAEAVLVEYDPEKIDYRSLVRLFFEIHDPTQKNRQGPDVGTQYRSAIFYFGETQRAIAAEAIAYLQAKGWDVATELNPAGDFYFAEDYHQRYFAKHERHGSCHVRQEIDWGN